MGNKCGSHRVYSTTLEDLPKRLRFSDEEIRELYSSRELMAACEHMHQAFKICVTIYLPVKQRLIERSMSSSVFKTINPMIFIFRQLRRLELRKRSGQYFLYAFGEIILIVVGILIALQIQNWNQGRLDRIEERYLLEELVDNLNQEAERLEYGIEFTEQRIEAFAGIRAFFETDSVSQEQFLEYLPNMSSYFLFNPNTSAYETMKNTDLGFSNRQLKARLVNYYDVEQVFLTERVSGQNEVRISIIRPIGIKYLKRDEDLNKSVPKDIHDSEFQEALLEPLDFLIGTQQGMIQECQKILDLNREILVLVEQELEN